MKCFDNEKFAKHLYDATWQNHLKYRDVAKEAGVSPSTVCRIVAHHKSPDVDSLAKLLDWLNMEFEDYIKDEHPSDASGDKK